MSVLFSCPISTFFTLVLLIHQRSPAFLPLMSTSGAVFVYYSRRSVFFLFPQMKTKLMLDSSNLFLKSVPSLPSYTALSFRVYAVLQTTNSSPENHMQLSFLTLDHDLGGGHYAALSLSVFSHFLLSLFLALALHYQQQHSIARISIFSFLTILPSLVLCFDTHTLGTALAH